MGLFSKLLKRRKQMMPSRTGMLRRLRGLGSLKNRMRPARPIFFGGNRSLFPFSSISNLPRRDMPLPPNLDVVTDEPIRDLDIMPRDAVMPKRPPQIGVAPDMTRGNAALLPPDIAPLPPKPMMGVNMGMPNFMSAGQPPKMVLGMKNGGDADKSDFPDLSGDGKITKKDILIGRGVIEMNMGGDPADEQARALMSEEDRMMANMSIPGIDMPSGSDADMMNYQNAIMNYRRFYEGQPINIQQMLPAPEAIISDPSKFLGVMQQDDIRSLLGEDSREIAADIDMMLQDLNNPEKKSLMSPSGM
tara:strand:- start:779 stop:1687 length:909 start_codon:yes stop_codon:yes gene_type:complete